MLKKNPHERITATEAIKHSYFRDGIEEEEADIVG
jgi:hypothetical protein